MIKGLGQRLRRRQPDEPNDADPPGVEDAEAGPFGGRRASRRPLTLRRAITMALMVLAFLLVPLGSVQAEPVCEGEPAPQPEAAESGADGLLVPPKAKDALERSPNGLPPDASLYGQYGTAGQQWHVIRESCVDKLGSSAAATLTNTVWELSKTINQSTITVYQAATMDGLLDRFNDLIENVIGQLREGVWRPLVPTVVILGAIWLGWYGLIRKRLTLTLEGAAWMVLATVLGIWILVNPSQILNMAGTVVNSGGQLINSAVSKVSVPGSAKVCPVGSPEVQKAEWESSSDFAVRKNSQMLWSTLVCQPWMAGEFGSGYQANGLQQQYGTELLAAQGISRVERQKIENEEISAAELIKEKQNNYEEIAANVRDTAPGVYPLFEGAQQDTRLSVAIVALFASIFAGGVIFVSSVALIVLKIGFILLLLFAPIFLLIGIHPGYGRTVLLRWFEMTLGLLLKQIFISLLISLLMMCYVLVMGSGLGWGLQVILLSLFTLALFIYRKPFAHLFQSVNANTFTSRMVNDALTSTALSRSANVLPPVAYMRAQKWGLKRAPQFAAAAGAVPAGGGGAGGGGATAGASETPDSGGVATAADAGDQDSGPSRGDSGRVRGMAGYGRAHGRTAPPPLQLGQNTNGDGPRSQQGQATRRDSSDAPRLSEAASGGLGPSSTSSPSSGGGSIPPRPAGGYRGTGDTGWASVFGTGSGSGHRPPPRGGDADRESEPPRSDGRAAPSSGRGIFSPRESTPPQGNVNKGSRWAGPRARRDKGAAPSRAPRPAPEGREGGHWFKSGDGGNKDRPISPFWAGPESQRRRDGQRDIPFWLRDE